MQCLCECPAGDAQCVARDFQREQPGGKKAVSLLKGEDDTQKQEAFQLPDNAQKGCTFCNEDPIELGDEMNFPLGFSANLDICCSKSECYFPYRPSSTQCGRSQRCCDSPNDFHRWSSSFRQEWRQCQDYGIGRSYSH